MLEIERPDTSGGVVYASHHSIKLAWKVLRGQNPELPEKWKLTLEHEQQLAESGITREAACVAGIFSADADLSDSLTGHKMSGLIFSYFKPDGISLYRYGESNKPFFRLKPDNPAGGAKYLSPKGAPTFIYFPRVTNQVNWVDVSGKKILITEGEKKSISACLSGLWCLGLGGVSSYATGARDSDTGKRELGALVEEVNLISAKSTTIIFDSDITQKDEVKGAIKAMAFDLCNAYREKERDLGGSVPRDVLKFNKKLRYSLLPNLPSEKIGLDDALMKFGADAVSELISVSLPLVHIKPDENDSKEIFISCLFSAEPIGDESHKKTPIHLQKHNRSLIAWLSTKGEWATVPGLGYLKYSKNKGIWDRISREEWGNLPEIVADLNGWHNRTGPVAAQIRQTCDNRLCLSRDLLDPPNLLAFTNGVLDLDSLSIEPAKPGHYLTQRLSFDYQPEASCDTWLNWLAWTFEEDIHSVRLIRALLRWTLQPKENRAHDIEVWPILIGRPQRGKGTFLEVLKGLVGEASGAWNLESISNPNGLFLIAGKLASICMELKGQIGSKTSTVLNQVISNEETPVKPLYKDMTQRRCNTVLWAASNEPLNSATSDRAGLDRRTLYIEFKRKPDRKDPFLKPRLLHELPGIFNWVWALPLGEAIETIRDYQGSELNLVVQQDMLEESNTVYQWLKDANFDSAQTNKLSDHYIQYCNWCEDAKIKNPLGRKTFSRELLKAGAEKKAGMYVQYTIPDFNSLDVKGLLGL